MVDTVKILIPIHNPSIFDGSRFTPITLEQLVNSSGYGKTCLNPSLTYDKAGKYMPRLTMYKRITELGIIYQLSVEFSAPKMLFGNNFDELTENDLGLLLTKIQIALQELIGYKFSTEELACADVSAWHPSKNIAFLDYTSCQTILNTMGKLDISRTYDLQKTDFRDGHIVHIHANSIDIAFYDKMADLLKAKKSIKRAFEKDSLVQIGILEDLSKYQPIDVFRYEVRLVGRASIKRAYPELKEWTLKNLFNKNLCRNTLIKHWEKLTSSLDMLALDVKEPYELFQNYIEANDSATPQAALAAVAGLLIANQGGINNLRNALEARYGRQAWYRIKPLLKSPRAHRFTAFLHIDEALQEFNPTRLADFLSNIENTGK
jgi:hypothetical protein